MDINLYIYFSYCFLVKLKLMCTLGKYATLINSLHNKNLYKTNLTKFKGDVYIIVRGYPKMVAEFENFMGYISFLKSNTSAPLNAEQYEHY